MNFLKWLIAKLVGLVKFCWSKRAKAYVRVALALITGGIAVLSVSPLVLLLQLLKVVAAPAGPDSPWWMDPAIGLLIVLLGVAVFILFYWTDPDRLKGIPLEESYTISIGDNWTFEEAALMVGDIAGKPVQLENFVDSERQAPMRSQQLTAPTPEQLLKDLRAVVITKAFALYDVERNDGTIIVRGK